MKGLLRGVHQSKEDGAGGASKNNFDHRYAFTSNWNPTLYCKYIGENHAKKLVDFEFGFKTFGFSSCSSVETLMSFKNKKIIRFI